MLEDPGSKLTLEELYAAYEEFAPDNGITHFTASQKLGQLIKHLMPNVKNKQRSKEGKQVYHYLGVVVQKPSVRRSMAQVNLMLPKELLMAMMGINILHMSLIFGLNREDESLQIMIGDMIVLNIYEFGIHTYDR